MLDKTTFDWGAGTVSGVWHRPNGPASTALVLAHGAGHGMDTRLLIDVAEALANCDIAVLRFNFPYAEAERRNPDPQPRLEASYLAVATTVAKDFERVYLGGKSMGGRIASNIVADEFPAAGLVFLGYPLHPPGQPARIRDAHLRRIEVPMLFLQGTRDPFATPELLHQTVEGLPTARLVEIVGGDHSFKVRGRSPTDVTSELVDAIAAFLST
jgi:uncharacterized protein